MQQSTLEGEWKAWLFLVHRSYHWLTEEFCSFDKQVLFVFCNCYCLSTSTSTICVGFIRLEIRALALTYTFIQATHKNSRSVSITSHADVNFYYQGSFSNIIQVRHERKHTASRTSEKGTGTLLQIHYLCIFWDSVFNTYVWVLCVQMDTTRGKCYLVKIFKHFMPSVKIILCLGYQEIIIELSVHTSTHTHII